MILQIRAYSEKIILKAMFVWHKMYWWIADKVCSVNRVLQGEYRTWTHSSP